MEKIKAKVEQVLHKDKDTTTTGTHGTTTHGTTAGTGTHTGTHTGTTGTHISDPSGPHDSRAANKVDPRVDSDLPGAAGNTGGAYGTHTTGHGLSGNTTSSGLGHSTHGTTGLGSNTTSTHGTTGLGSNTHGTHGTTGLGSNTTSTHGTHGTTGLGSNTHGTTGGFGSNSRSDPSGPHDSKLANKLDPRVDSDQPGNFGNSGGARTGNTGIGHSTGHSTTGHTSGGGLTSGTTGAYGSDPSGPHDSRFANSADPRVDHDRDGSRTVGNTGAGYSGTHTGAGLSGGSHTGAGLSGGSHTGAGLSGGSHTGTYGSDPSGPHNSRLANSADPRVDHDRDGSRTTGNTGAGLTGGHSTHGTHGTTGGLGGHSNTTGYSGTTAGGNLPGPADKTAGPHKSDVLNKLDPRVDSDVDGSKTVGQQPTYR